ncbi:MAG: 4-alpha-glucanotransferase [Clostridia bacterium]|nr:4-alpha-glucanotransferase [Clostridia bacterium]
MEGVYERGAGVLCHISSLPGKYGIGSLGDEAYDFARLLKTAHVKYWQILPLVQTGFGDSPYQSVCCNSGNPLFIDLKALREEGLLDEEELKSAEMPLGKVDYQTLNENRYNILRLAYARFNVKNKDFVAFVESGEYDDYAIFMSLKSRYGGTFDTFPDAYKYKEKLALLEFKRSVYKSDYLFWQFVQYKFDVQWKQLKNYVNSLGIKIIGDIPLYVAYDSADVWGNPKLFKLDRHLNPEAVAGVPPDYFSEDGQLWGNPLYDWEGMAVTNYEWWIKRIEKSAKLYDIIRIDHFRGFDRYYSIPSDSTTAKEGEWLQGPGLRLFSEVKRRLGDIEIIAEDLGALDSGVHRLRERTGFPGMKVLQFAFDGSADNPYLPANIDENSVVYTGTHDNDTTLGFINGMSDADFRQFKKMLRNALKSESITYPFVSREDAVTAMNVCALASPARIAVLPVQDIMYLDTYDRMNIPSTAEGNWQFRMADFPSRKHMAILRKMIDGLNR